MKILCFILGVFLVATVAEKEIENIVRGRRHIGSRHANGLEDSNSENQGYINDGSHRHHHFTHNADLHRRNRIPMPDEVNGNHRNHHYHFTHNPEWHRRNGIPMHDERHPHGYYPRPNNRNPTSTSTTTTTTDPFKSNIPTSTRRNTVDQSDSRDIFDNTRTTTENYDTVVINTRHFRTKSTTTESDFVIRSSTARTTAEQSDSREIFDSRTNTGSTSTASTLPAEWDSRRALRTTTTVEPEYSREIYDNRRTQTEYDDIEMINMP